MSDEGDEYESVGGDGRYMKVRKDDSRVFLGKSPSKKKIWGERKRKVQKGQFLGLLGYDGVTIS